MPDIRPFCGIYYNPQKIEDIAKVVTEPYDVISPSQQAAYYKLHPYNIIRLILGKQKFADTAKNNRYTRAKEYLADWLRKDILLCDGKESIYIYAQTFPSNNRKRTRTGFIVLLKLEDFAKNTILPHENTFSLAVQDRLKLLQETSANLSPIFAMFGDSQGKINKLLSRYKRDHQPYIVIKKDKVLHRLWRMSEKRGIATIKKLLKGRQIFIADGHHRYEAALNYKIQMQKRKRQPQGLSSFNYVMTYLVATTDPGLTILPTHRVVRIKAHFLPQEFVRDLKRFFDIHSFSTSDKLFSYMQKKRGVAHIFGAYFGKNKFCGLTLKNARSINKFIDRKERGLHRDLSVMILHRLIIEQILNIVPMEKNIYYTRDGQEVIKLVDAGIYQVGLFLQPTTVMQVKRVAKAGERMPHKSTYFYPKLLTGLAINKL